MMTTNLAALKKRRTILRNRIKADILQLIKMSEGELTQFEATHALLDTIINDCDNAVRSYGASAALTVGLAQTYLPSTLELAEEQAQANGGPVKKVKNALKSIVDPAAYKMTNWVIQGQKANLLTVDDLPGADATGPETVFAKITKNLDKWEHAQPMVYMMGGKNMVVGGDVAKKTVEEYGYELPAGYDFVETPWGSYTITKLTPKSKPVHFCGTKGCLDVDVPFLGGVTVTGQTLYGFGLKASAMQQQYPTKDYGVHIDHIPNQDAVHISVFDPASTDLDAHLKTYMADSIKAQVNAPNPLLSGVIGNPWDKHASQTYAVKASSTGKVVEVPFKKWIPKSFLEETGLYSSVLPNGVMWHTHFDHTGDDTEFFLDYAGSPTPVWDLF
jgi:hypothetical protein